MLEPHSRCAPFCLLAYLVLPMDSRSAGIAPTDATTGASIFVDSGRTTDSSATLFWHESKMNGKMRLYWDTLPIVSFPAHALDSLEWLFVPGQVTTVRPTTATFPGPGKRKLSPGRTYWYYLQGFYPYPDHTGNEQPPYPSMAPVLHYTNHGSFQTSGTASILSRGSKTPPVQNLVLRDASGHPVRSTRAGIVYDRDGGRVQPRTIASP